MTSPLSPPAAPPPPPPATPPGGEAASTPSDERFAKTFRASPIAIGISRLEDGLILEANPSWCELFGYTVEEAVGHTAFELGLFVETADRRRAVALLREQGFLREFDLTMRRKSGEIRDTRLWSEIIEINGERCAINMLLDVTERRQAEEALRQSEERFAKAFHAGPDALIITRRADGVILDVNESWCRLYGIRREQALGRTVPSFDIYIEPAERARMLSLVAEQGSVRDFETGVRAVSGEIRVVTASVEQVEVAGEVCLLTMIRDITEQRRAEQERQRLLRELETERRSLQAVLEQLPGGLIIAEGATGRVVLGNQQAEVIWRHPVLPTDGVADYAAWQGFHADGRPYAAEEWPLARALASGEVVTGEEIVFQRGDGTRGVMMVNASPVRDQAGQAMAGVVTFYDVTERKREEERQRFLADISALLGSSLEDEQIWQRVTRFALPAFANFCSLYVRDDDGRLRLLAVADERGGEGLAQAVDSRYHPDADTAGSLTGQVLRTQQPVLIPEITLAFFDALPVDAEVKQLLQVAGMSSLIIAPIVARGGVLGVLTLMYTHSGRHYDEADLALAQELGRRVGLALDNARLYRQAQQAIEVRDNFLSIASHELKTPLTSLTIQLQLMRQRFQHGDFEKLPPERLARLLAIGEEQVRRLTTLVNDLLDVAKIEAGRLEVDRQPVDLVAVVAAVVERCAEQALSVGSAVHLDAPTPVVGRFDPSRLDQVVTNLLTNAIKYGAGQPIQVSVSGDDHSARLVVKDRGIGIRPDRLAHIFERFERAVVPGQYGGMGLGLYISREIVQDHGGTIRVESRPGDGATFMVELPRDAHPA